ncbi:MAG TPA: metallophosphoesterase family protein [Bryobacteraceae bacterium]|nr:metallophosphoesterase family protein [Bryobacteraceae bacterium]
MRIGLLSDTHGFLDQAVFTCFEDCDELWHAGDFGSIEVLDRLRTFRPVRGVYGNVDGSELRAALPRDLAWECEGLRVLMTHVGGHPGKYDRRAAQEIARVQPDLFITGHSHILKVVCDSRSGLLHMNPGACGHQGWQMKRTIMRFKVAATQIASVEVIQLGPRGRSSVPCAPEVERLAVDLRLPKRMH